MLVSWWGQFVNTWRHRKSIKRVLIALLAFCAFALASMLPVMAWQGGFQQAEYNLYFTSETGEPIADVELSVEAESGERSYYYPVTDYTAVGAIKSNVEGLLTFHHVCSHPIEFGGMCRHCCFVIPVGDCAAPVYYCVFSHKGREVYRMKYNALNSLAREIRDRPADDPNPRIVKKLPWSWGPDVPDSVRPEVRSFPKELEFTVVHNTVTLHMQK